MPLNLRDFGLLDRARSVLDELMLHLDMQHVGLAATAPKQAADAHRKAKALSKSLAALKAEVEKPLSARSPSVAERLRTVPDR